MSTQAYRTWNAAGRPFTVAKPIAELVVYSRFHGNPILGTIGNDAHLLTDFPEDHTPFSFTPWPVPLPGYIVTACDLKSGDWCWGFLEDCKNGLYPWVKYINFFGYNYSVKRNWGRVTNSDDHFHCSARTDFLNSPVGRDPWNRAPVSPPAVPSRTTRKDQQHMFFFCANADGGPDTAGDEKWAVVSGGQWFEFSTQDDGDRISRALLPFDPTSTVPGRSAEQCSPAAWARLKAEFTKFDVLD